MEQPASSDGDFPQLFGSGLADPHHLSGSLFVSGVRRLVSQVNCAHAGVQLRPGGPPDLRTEVFRVMTYSKWEQ